MKRAFTLVEMLIAMVLTLIMVYAIAEFYAYVGETVRDGRALIEMRGGMRTTLQRLKDDLDHRTATVQPPTDDGSAKGYLCITEGIGNDAAPIGGVIDSDGDGSPDIAQDTNRDGTVDYLELGDATNLLGDNDDVIAMTIRAGVDPFSAPVAVPDFATGEWTGATQMQSGSLAEVIWWSGFTDNPTFANAGTWDLGETRAIHRRLLLVRPDKNVLHGSDPNGYTSQPYYAFVDDPPGGVGEAYYRFMQASDVSVRVFVLNGDAYFVANSLADLTRRENRFMNVVGASNFPNLLDLNPNFAGVQAQPPWNAANDRSLYRWTLDGVRRGEDVALSNALAFDVRLYDPTAILLADPGGSVTLQPGDAGYGIGIASTYTPVGAGAYVDLAYNRYTLPTATPSQYSQLPTGRSQFGTAAVYDTWATSYERDGLNQDFTSDGAANINTGPFDEGRNGLDDDNQNGVDDTGDLPVGENETLPPYPRPLRGLEVRVRIYDPGTRQAQQATVGTDFVAD